MKEIIQAMQQAEEKDLFVTSVEVERMRLAAKSWATHCIEAQRGKQLRAGLRMAAAITEWCNTFDSYSN